MTDRVFSLTVMLNREMRVDDVEHLVDAISMMRGVMKVEKGPVADLDHHYAKEHVSRELKKKVLAALDPDLFDLIEKNKLT